MAEKIGEFIRRQMLEGADNATVLAEVLGAFPGARTTLQSVRWYRNKLSGTTALTTAAPEPEATTEAPAGRTVEWSVSSLKTFRGTNGEGFNATLCRDGQQVAFVIDDGNGGYLHYEWMDRNGKGRVEVTTQWHESTAPATYRVTPFEAELVAHVKTLPREVNEYFPEGMTVNPDSFVNQLVEDELVRRDLKRALGRKTLFQRTDGRIMEVKGLPDRRTRDHIAERYPGAVVLNDLPFGEALELYGRKA